MMKKIGVEKCLYNGKIFATGALMFMFYPESRCFHFSRKYSGVTLRAYNTSFTFSHGGCYSAAFFDRTGSVLFSDFHARSFIFCNTLV